MTVELRAEGLSKRYGALTAVDSLSLTVRTGEILALLGPNGAGKTTTISMLCGLLPPDRGRVVLTGADGRPGTVRRRVGLCPQQIEVWDRLTCREQLLYLADLHGLPRRDSRARAAELLGELGLGDRCDQQARRLSGGMQRRLNLAMALVHSPDALVLDEPSAGLDPQSRVLVRDYVAMLAGCTAVLLTSHDMDEVERLADRVAVMDHGLVLATGTPEQLKRDVGADEVIELTADHASAEALGRALAGLVPPENVVVRGDAVQLRTQHAVGLLPAAVERLDRAGVRYRDVRVRQASLEDVFLALTGRELRG